MTEFRRMIINVFMVIYCQFQVINGQFNLYHTDKSLMMSIFGYDCLYYHQDELLDASTNFVPFCRRPVLHSNDHEIPCNGKTMTFKQLKTNNATAQDLFYWNAPIEIIESYEKYVTLDKPGNDNDQYFCNCSDLSRFGRSCQYDMNTSDTQRSFTQLLWTTKSNPDYETTQKEYFTCYIAVRCQTNLVCLDWRQICNGIVDCADGEDEPFDLCLQMESNECDAEKEFRCQNGMCIPISMMHRATGACLDRTDDTELYIGDSLIYLTTLCLDYPSIECDAINHGWKRFSCNNGQYIAYSDLTSTQEQIGHTCANNRHRIYLKQLFSVNNENQCWKAMICLTGFDYLYPHIDCSHQNITESIEEWCPNEYYFPSNSVVYSFVFFLFDKLNHINWINSPGPDYICYKNDYCQTNSFTFPTIPKDNLRCFPVNQRMFSWQNFYEYVTHVFSSCFHTFSSAMINNPMFYRCDLSNTYISVYRVKNKRKDCYFNEDERRSINLCSLKTNDQFRCLTNTNECVRQTFLNDHEYDCLDGSDEYFYPRIERCNDLECDFRPWSKKNLAEIYRFNELCDNIVNHHVQSCGGIRIKTSMTDLAFVPPSS